MIKSVWMPAILYRTFLSSVVHSRCVYMLHNTRTHTHITQARSKRVYWIIYESFIPTPNEIHPIRIACTSIEANTCHRTNGSFIRSAQARSISPLFYASPATYDYDFPPHSTVDEKRLGYRTHIHAHSPHSTHIHRTTPSGTLHTHTHSRHTSRHCTIYRIAVDAMEDTKRESQKRGENRCALYMVYTQQQSHGSRNATNIILKCSSFFLVSLCYTNTQTRTHQQPANPRQRAMFECWVYRIRCFSRRRLLTASTACVARNIVVHAPWVDNSTQIMNIILAQASRSNMSTTSTALSTVCMIAAYSAPLIASTGSRLFQLLFTNATFCFGRRLGSILSLVLSIIARFLGKGNKIDGTRWSHHSIDELFILWFVKSLNSPSNKTFAYYTLFCG